MKRAFKSVSAAMLAAVLTTAAPSLAAAAETAAVITAADSERSQTETMYITKTCYSYEKNSSKADKVKRLYKGAAVEVASETKSFYKLKDGSYVFKKNVGEMRINWTVTRYKTPLTRYIAKDGTKARSGALPGSEIVDTLNEGEKLTIVGRTNSGFYKLQDGSYVRQTSVTAAKPVQSDSPDEGRVLNIWCWNDELQQRVISFYPGYKDNGDGTGTIGDVKVVWTINPNIDNGYQITLDAALLKQDRNYSNLISCDCLSGIGAAACSCSTADNIIDMFLVEADFADKYINSYFTLPVSDVGITDADTAGMYEYTKQIGTDENGVLKAVSWQAHSGAFAYRRSVAKEVLGTDDPEEVRKYVADWDTFNETAAKMKEKGYYMLSGYDDAYRTFSNNLSSPWVNGNNEIVIDQSLISWVKQTKEFTDKGYNNGSNMWSYQWMLDQSPGGRAFGFFYPTWGVNFVLPGNAGEEDYGDWAVCYGPQPYYWGGTWLCASYQTDNKTLVGDIMYQLTCNDEIMEQMTRDPYAQDYTNSMTAMAAIAADADYGSEFLGGQNHIAVFDEIAKSIDMSSITGYDALLNEQFRYSFTDYFMGNVDFETALNNFYCSAVVIFPNLSVPKDVPSDPFG